MSKSPDLSLPLAQPITLTRGPGSHLVTLMDAAILIRKLDLLRVECPKCGRSGRYRLADLITRYGRDEKLFAFTADITANCARKQARSDGDPCGAICPDLPKVL